MWPFVAFALAVGIPDRLFWAKVLTAGLAVVGTAYIVRLPARRP